MITTIDTLELLDYIMEKVNDYYYYDCDHEDIKDDPKNLANMPEFSDKLLNNMGITEEHLNRPDYPMYIFLMFVCKLLKFIAENKFYEVNNIATNSFLNHLKTIDESIDEYRFKKFIKCIDRYIFH